MWKWNRNTRQFEPGHFSADFQRAWGPENESRTLDMHRYEQTISEFVQLHEKKMMFAYLKMFVLFVAGLWAVYVNAIFWAVLLLALAHNYNRQSSHHMLVSELMNAQRPLAMLVNNQARSAGDL